jgi:dUTP pyrophosphatase
MRVNDIQIFAQFAGAALFLLGMLKLGYELGKSHGLRQAARRAAKTASRENLPRTKTEMNLTFKRLHPDAVLPTYAKPGDSGLDLHAVEDVVLLPGVPTLVRTGLAVELPEGAKEFWTTQNFSGQYRGAWVDKTEVKILFEAQIRPRSGLALKHGITVVNSPGTVDSGYRGEIGVILRWDGYGANAWEFRRIGDNPFDDSESEWIDSTDVLRLVTERPELEHVKDSFGYRIRKGDRIAQMVICPVAQVQPQWGEISKTERGAGGFGSSGE